MNPRFAIYYVNLRENIKVYRLHLGPHLESGNNSAIDKYDKNSKK